MDSQNYLSAIARLIPIATAAGVVAGFIYEAGYFGQFNMGYFFLFGLTDHAMNFLLFVTVTLIVSGITITFRIVDDVTPGRSPGFIWVGNKWIRWGSLIAFFVFLFLLPKNLASIPAVAAIIFGVSTYFWVVHQRREDGQKSKPSDLLVAFLPAVIGIYGLGAAKFHTDIGMDKLTTLNMQDGASRDVIWLRGSENGVLVFDPVDKSVEFVLSREFNSIQTGNIKAGKSKIFCWVGQWIDIGSKFDCRDVLSDQPKALSHED